MSIACKARALLYASLVVIAGIAIPNTADARETVTFRDDYSPGTIVIRTNERRLYYVMPARPTPTG